MDALPRDRQQGSHERARGRWNLLRQAVVTSAADKKNVAGTEENASSIHKFRGYGLLEPPTDLDYGSVRLMVQSLSLIQCPSKEWTFDLLSEELKLCVSALQAVNCLTKSPLSFTISISPSLPSDLTRDLDKLSTDITTSWHDDYFLGPLVVIDSRTVQVALSPSSLHVVRKYSVDSQSTILTRERVNRTIRNLQELVSNQYHDGVDNTGNLCVWDAEKTLAWALLQESGPAPRTVTELGSGTAALAALALASRGGVASEFCITDGHHDSVWNNRVNLTLMRAAAALSPPSPRIVCQKLLWTCTESRVSCPERFPAPADLTLVSDCTHFEEHHGSLLWTLVECTAVGGRIWMCQPNRGRSWDKFVQLVDLVNGQPESSLLRLQERTYDEIERRHQRFLHDESYQPDIHKPRIFVMVKLREATERDRHQVLHHLETRTLLWTSR